MTVKYIVYLQVDNEDLNQYMEDNNYRNPEKTVMGNVERVLEYVLESTGISVDSIKPTKL